MKERMEPYKWFESLRKTEFWKTNKKVHVLLYAIFGVAFYLLLIENILPQQFELKEGEISPTTIVAPATKIDEIATRKAQERAGQAINPVYRKDNQITNGQMDQVDRFFSDVRRILSDSSTNESEKISIIKDVVGEKEKKFSKEFILKLVRTPMDQLTEIRVATREIVTEIMSDGVKESELGEKMGSVDQKLVISSLSSNSRYLVRELAKFYITPNEFYDAEKTKALREAAMDNTDPVTITKGQVIVTQGEKITSDQYEKLNTLNLIRSTNQWGSYVGLALLLLVVLVLLYFYIQRFHHSVALNNFNVIMLFLVLGICLVGMKLIAIGQNLEWSTLGYLSPVALGGMLVTLLLNVELGFACIVLLSIATSVYFSGENHQLFDFRFGLVALIGGITSAFALSGVKRRSSILFAGFLGSVASVITIVALFFILPVERNWEMIWQSLSFGFASGVFSSILTIGFLPGFESLFQILSPLRLLELSNPNHPLLKKLLYEAPGTYHHSVIVGNLSEAAAEAIGANGLLARVGAYYHDLGKTKRPQFFVENQIGKENPHDKISPNLSKTIIISHPRDGVELLKEFRIPEPLQDIAAQHHGTTLLKYFYYKALESNEGNVIEEDYRYPGPKAQFKEAAIVGIADCVEAAVRSLSKPSPARIEGMVKKIIQQRLEDGQLDECDLTIKELNLIAQAICATLQGIFHNRIEYPESPTLVGKGVKQA